MAASGNLPGTSNSLQVQIPCIIFFVLTPIFIAVRLWSRIHMRAGLKWDDWTILVSFVFSMTVSILIMLSCHYGFGQHIKNLTPYNRKMTLQTFWIAQGFYKLTSNLTKASIILLYLRIFVQKPFRIACNMMLAIILAYMAATWFATIFQCNPIPRAWNKTIPGTCIDLTKNWYANAGFSIATDLIILVLPMPLLWQSRLPLNQKAALMGVFALGAFVVVTSIFRMQTLDFSTKTPDITYDILSSLWTMVEPNVAIICACLPMCRLPLTMLFPTVFPPKTIKSTSYASGPRSKNGNYGHAGTAKNEWVPSRGGAKEERAINLTSVSRGLGDDNSEEFIFHDKETAMNYTDGKRIHKVTDYTVTYEDDDTNTIGRGKVQEEVSKV
ncbi:related to integral membrane protein [Rhynchosporium graminicola]|uniref:Related to integral membrane protein n=1 Tax=Rhynchosporium graminicola TaxID=2792576 RepID=A0A1E1K266_9HELO|nr:related to integral membrane protein [Rhynchosporium commune]